MRTETWHAVSDLMVCPTDRYYKESHKVLGQTFGMLVLQDFEALTPNLLARTIETVEGGGIVCLLLKDLKSLKQVYNMTMVSIALLLRWSRSINIDPSPGCALPIPDRGTHRRSTSVQRTFHLVSRFMSQLPVPR
jgi:hypothetical protein